MTKIIGSAQKWMIVNHYKSLRPETGAIHYRDMMQHISTTLGIGLHSVRKTISEYKRTNTVSSPSRKRNRSSSKCDQIDSFDKNVIRKKIYSIWLDREIPTVYKLLSAINRDQTLPNTKICDLKTMLNSLSFKCTKQKRNCVLLERSNLILRRRKYLSSIRKFREEGRPIYYMGETLFYTDEVRVDQKPSFKLKLSESLSLGSTTLTNEGKRFIILHIGSADGFVPRGLLCMETRKNSSDYRDEIKSQHFREWFEEILPFLNDNAVIVLGNACYQSEKSEKIPTIEWKKEDIVKWLLLNGEEIDPENMVKIELMEIIKRIKPKYDTYVIDEIAKQNDKYVLRLPPFHSELNAIELVWPLIKQHIMESDVTFDTEILHQSFESFKIKRWQSCISHTIKDEEELRNVDIITDELIDQLNSGPSDLSFGDLTDSSDDDEVLCKNGKFGY